MTGGEAKKREGEERGTMAVDTSLSLRSIDFFL